MKLHGRVVGLDQLSSRLSAIADEAAFAADLRETAEEIRERAAANLAGGGASDALARSVTVSANGQGGYVVGTPLDYGWHREFGSRRRAARPWLTPAAEEAGPGLVARLVARIRSSKA